MMGKLSSLLSKKYTFIFVPDVTGKFMRFSIPRSLVKGVIGLAVVFAASFSWFAWTVMEKSAELVELQELRITTAEHKTEIERFAQKMKQVEGQLARLDRFDKKLRVITALEKQPTSSVEFGAGGPIRDMDSLDLSHASKAYTRSLIDALDKDLDQIKNQAESQEVSFFELDEFFREQSSLLTHTPSIWPVKGWVTSTFGYRQSPFTGLREMHEGIDVATQMKAPIIAPAGGIIIRTGFDRGYGNLLEIDHGYGVVTKFGHTSKVLVSVGQKIKRGDVVALVGSTGRSTGPHLHYEVLLNGVPVNPFRYILEN